MRDLSQLDPRHADYCGYYRARAQRRQGDPLYPRSASAEQRLSEALEGCAGLADFRAVLEGEKLELRCAIARAQDQSAARAAHFRAMAEPVRARGPEAILADAGSAQDASALHRLIGEHSNRNSVEISVDLFTDAFWSDFQVLEALEVAAEIADQVPVEWRAEITQQIAAGEQRGRANYQDHLKVQARHWDPSWELDYALVMQERHRRKIPEPDAVVNKRIAQHKRYTGRA